jgi:hypothetical protein
MRMSWHAGHKTVFPVAISDIYYETIIVNVWIRTYKEKKSGIPSISQIHFTDLVFHNEVGDFFSFSHKQFVSLKSVLDIA